MEDEEPKSATVLVGNVLATVDDLEGRLNQVLLDLLDNASFEYVERDIIVARCEAYRVRTRAQRVLRQIEDGSDRLFDARHVSALVADMQAAAKEAQSLLESVMTAHQYLGKGERATGEKHPNQPPWEWIVTLSGELTGKIGFAADALEVALVLAKGRGKS